MSDHHERAKLLEHCAAWEKNVANSTEHLYECRKKLDHAEICLAEDKIRLDQARAKVAALYPPPSPEPGEGGEGVGVAIHASPESEAAPGCDTDQNKPWSQLSGDISASAPDRKPVPGAGQESRDILEQQVSAASAEGNSPYEIGWRARKVGLELWQNPFSSRGADGPTVEFKEWEQGYLDSDNESQACEAPADQLRKDDDEVGAIPIESSQPPQPQEQVPEGEPAQQAAMDGPFASTADLARELGFGGEDADRIERGVNAILNRGAFAAIESPADQVRTTESEAAASDDRIEAKIYSPQHEEEPA